MTIGFLFWLLMILWLLFGLYWHWPNQPGPAGFGVLGGNLLLFLLLFLLGWRTFGFVIQGYAPPAAEAAMIFDSLLRALARWFAPGPDPGPPPGRRARPGFTLVQVYGTMPKTFDVSIQLPPLPDVHDIAKQELTVTADGAVQPTVAVDTSAETFPVGNYPEGANLTVRLVYVDTSGNRSEPQDEAFTVTDNVAPPKPGEFGFTSEQVFEDEDPGPPRAR